MTTGQRIKEQRKRLGISAETLADKLGVSPATVYRYENGDIEKVPGDRLIPIADALSTTPAFLMGWENENSADEQIDLYMRGIKKWSEDFRLSDIQKSRLKEYLADLFSKTKEYVNRIAESKQSEDGKILKNPALQQAEDNLSHWATVGVQYINNEFSNDPNDPFDYESIREQYLCAIAQLSKRDQVAWLIRLQDYIEASKEEPK